MPQYPTDVSVIEVRTRAEASPRLRLAAIFGTLLGGCAVAPVARAPVIPAHADENTRRSLYDDYALKGRVGPFGESWTRADGEYSWAGLKYIAEQYPSTEEVYKRASTRLVELGLVADFGGALIGGTLGWNLAASDAERMPSSAQITLYSVGGAMVVGSLLILLLSHDPAADFADTYNSALRQDLGIPAAPSRPPKGALRWVPRPFEGGYAWRFQ